MKNRKKDYFSKSSEFFLKWKIVTNFGCPYSFFQFFWGCEILLYIIQFFNKCRGTKLHDCSVLMFYFKFYLPILTIFFTLSIICCIDYLKHDWISYTGIETKKMIIIVFFPSCHIVVVLIGIQKFNIVPTFLSPFIS